MELIQRATNALGVPEPAVALASTDPQVIQLVELLNQEGRALASRYGWQALTFEQTFTTAAAEDQGALASLITGGRSLRYILNETIWNRTRREPCYGPRAARDWQAQKAFSVTGPYPEYRIRAGRFLMLPAPSAGETCAFEYVTKSWLTSAAADTYYQNAAADTDVALLDDELLLAGLEWRWRRAKGLSYAEEFSGYERQVADAMARDGTKASLSLCGRSGLEGVPQAIPRLIGS